MSPGKQEAGTRVWPNNPGSQGGRKEWVVGPDLCCPLCNSGKGASPVTAGWKTGNAYLGLKRKGTGQTHTTVTPLPYSLNWSFLLYSLAR